MDSLKLNEILRYLATGAIPPIYLVIGFKEPLNYLLQESAPSIALAGMFLISFLIGSASYSMYRALLYPGLLYCAVRIVGGDSTPHDMDITRWKNLAKNGNLQKYLSEWASQIHFMYVSSVLGLLTIGVARLENLSATESNSYLVAFSLLLFIAAFISHCRYLKREAATFERDAHI